MNKTLGSNDYEYTNESPNNRKKVNEQMNFLNSLFLKKVDKKKSCS